MTAKVKICGLSRICDIDAVNAERPDYIGFVFAKSRRQVTVSQAFGLRERLAPGVIPVGVFANEDMANIVSLVRHGVIDLIQLHGSEDETYILRIKALTGVPVIKAIAVLAKGGVQKWSGSAADYLLLDGSGGGGTGHRFDWNLIGKTAKPFFLAGGLNPVNAGEALSRVRPFAADVSSGVETGGYKDRAKIREFIRRIRHERPE